MNKLLVNCKFASHKFKAWQINYLLYVLRLLLTNYVLLSLCSLITQNAILRRHMLELTQSFMIPLVWSQT